MRVHLVGIPLVTLLNAADVCSWVLLVVRSRIAFVGQFCLPGPPHDNYNDDTEKKPQRPAATGNLVSRRIVFHDEPGVIGDIVA